jgi:porin
MFRASKGCWLGWFLAGVSGLGAAYGQDANYPTGDIPEWLQSYGYEEGAEGQVSDPQAAAADQAAADPSAAAGRPNAGAGSQTPPALGLFQRPNLTGDWGGRRTALQESGIVYRGRVTQFFMGVGGGVNPPVPPQFAALGIAGGDTFEYTGNSRHDFLISLDKFGGLPHSKLVVTTENIWGRFGNVSLETGAFSAPVFNAFMPVDADASGSLFLTNFMLVQPLSEKFILTIGKTRTVGIADNNIFAGGDGSDQFLNQTFIGSPLMFPNIPFSTFAVAAVMPQEWGNISLSVMDGVDRSTDFMDFGSLFANGATIFGQVKVDTDFFGLPGEQHVGGFYKNVDQVDLTFAPLPPQYPYPPAPPGTPQFLQRSESYAFFYGFDQYLVAYGPPDAKGNSQGWGIFGRASLADDASGNPNWGAWHVSAGIGGDSPLPSRSGKGDRFGIGYAYTATSTEFGPIPQALFAPRDAQNIEIYYRYQLTPAIEITPDVQWVRGMLGGLTDGDGAVVAGIRLNIKL